MIFCAPGQNRCFFLDYVAMGRDDPARLEQIVQGISDGCVAGDMALLGGETAIMPDMYGEDDYDLAGFAVGVVERKKLVTGRQIADGDVVLGIASSGLHSNGFSLVRKIIGDAGLDWEARPDGFDGKSLGDICLEPTRIYTNVIRSVQSHYHVKQVIHGLAHITGGGFEENLDRILPNQVDALIDPSSWNLTRDFQVAAENGRRRRCRDAARIQHGHGNGDGRQRILRGGAFADRSTRQGSRVPRLARSSPEPAKFVTTTTDG